MENKECIMCGRRISKVAKEVDTCWRCRVEQTGKINMDEYRKALEAV